MYVNPVYKAWADVHTLDWKESYSLEEVKLMHMLVSEDIRDWLDEAEEFGAEAVERLQESQDIACQCLLNWGVPWEGFDPDYPNNPFLYGIDVDGISYATGYTGVSGNYWEKQEHTRWMWVCGTFEEEK